MAHLHTVCALFCLLILHLPLSNALYPIELIFQFQPGVFLENIAVRSDGSLLTSLVYPEADLFLFAPSTANPNPQQVYNFANATSVLGITEISPPDTYIVAVTTLSEVPGRALPGYSSLWRVAFINSTSAEANVTLLTNIPDVQTPNGLVTLNKHKILLADSEQGVVYAIDTNTGKSNIAIRDPLFANKGLPTSVNGLKIRGNDLYFTNTAQNILGKVPINLKTGTARGRASVIARAIKPSKGFSDFALSTTEKGIAYVTNTAGNFVERVDLRNRKQTIIAGQINSTDLAEPSAAALGRNGNETVLFVTTGGGLLIPVDGVIVGGGVFAIQLPEKSSPISSYS